MSRNQVVIIGAGLAGLSAAATLAENKIPCALVSVQPSERAQSVLAEGGINAALDVMGEKDSVEEHFADTMRGGVQLADPEAVRALTQGAPDIVRKLAALGVPFMMEGQELIQRNFGGQKKKRTAYCRSSTGKALMTAMTDHVRQYEVPNAQEREGFRNLPLVQRFSHHRFERLMIENGCCCGAWIRDTWNGEILALYGPVILACGGPNGLFPCYTTGTTANDGSVLAAVFSQGAELANLEFIQYHPTTAAIPGKRLLVSEAARGEGGRLYVNRNGSRWYFMEDLYPELGNLMPRDVISREMTKVIEDPSCQGQVWLDLASLSKDTWKRKLPDLRAEIRHYLHIDPAKEPVPVSPGIHFFMGGIRVDAQHRTNIPGLYAAGECACQYHGANRLGGNSLLGALYGGKTAAETAMAAETASKGRQEAAQTAATGWQEDFDSNATGEVTLYSPAITEQVCRILTEALGIIRHPEKMEKALTDLELLLETQTAKADRDRIILAKAMIHAAMARKESRGAHQRADHPERDDGQFQKTTIVRRKGDKIEISFSSV